MNIRQDGGFDEDLHAREQVRRCSFLRPVYKCVVETVQFVGGRVKGRLRSMLNTPLSDREVGNSSQMTLADKAFSRFYLEGNWQGDFREKGTLMKSFAELCYYPSGSHMASQPHMVRLARSLYANLCENLEDNDFRQGLRELTLDEVKRIINKVGIPKFHFNHHCGLSAHDVTADQDIRLNALKILSLVVTGTDFATGGGRMLFEFKTALQTFDYQGFNGQRLVEAQGIVRGILNFLQETDDSAVGIGGPRPVVDEPATVIEEADEPATVIEEADDSITGIGGWLLGADVSATGILSGFCERICLLLVLLAVLVVGNSNTSHQ